MLRFAPTRCEPDRDSEPKPELYHALREQIAEELIEAQRIAKLESEMETLRAENKRLLDALTTGAHCIRR